MSKTKFLLTCGTVILVSSLAFSACGKSELDTPDAGTSGGTTDLRAEEKSGDTVVSGSISEAGGKYFVTPAGSTAKEIESYAVDLSAYVGQTVTITGQYSGDTLFVGKIE